MRPRYEGTIMRIPIPAIRSIVAVAIICLACAAPEARAQEESMQPPSAVVVVEPVAAPAKPPVKALPPSTGSTAKKSFR